MNENFQKIEREFNEKTLRRDGLGNGEPNHMEVDLDMNSQDVINVGNVSAKEVFIEGAPVKELLNDTIIAAGEEADRARDEADRADGEADRAKQEADRAERTAKDLDGPYSFLGDYGPGLVATSYNQVVRDSEGEFWRVSGQVDLPYTTTGTGLPEDDAFVPAGDAVLRQDLAHPDLGAAMVARGVVAVDSIADLLALPPGQRKEGLRYLVKGYHAGSDAGGGEIYWDSLSTEVADNGTVFSVQGLSVGRYKRKIQSVYSPKDFGAKGDGQASDAPAIQAMMQSQVSPVEWGTKNDVYVVDQQCQHSYSKGAVVEWRGGGAQVVTPVGSERLSNTLALEVHGGEVRISDLTIKVNYRSIRALAIRNLNPVMDSSDKTDCYLSNITAEEFATNENIGQSAGGITVIGAFSRATFNGCVVRNGLNTLVAWEAGGTLTGFSVAGSSAGGAVEKVSFESCEIDGLRGETPAVNSAMNGVSCFDPHGVSPIDLPTTCTITNLISRNVWGRDIKLQRFSYSINECGFYNDEEGPDDPIRGFIGLQGGTGQVSNVRFYMRSYPKTAFGISSYASLGKSATDLRHCYAYNLTSKLCRRFLGTHSPASAKPANVRATDCSAEGRYNEFGYIDCAGDTAPLVRLDDCRADSLELDTSREDYENETSPWFLYARLPSASGTARVTMVDCGYTGGNVVYPVRVRVRMHLEGHGNYGFAYPVNGVGTPMLSTVVYGTPVMVSGAITTNLGSSADNIFPGVMMHQSIRITPNETYEFQLHNGANSAASSFCVIKLDSSRFFFAMFIWDGTMINLRVDQNFSNNVLMSNSEPAAFDVADRLYVWGSGNKIKVRSTRTTDNTVSLFSA